MERMLRKCSLTLLAICWGCFSVLHAQTFDKLWKEVEQAQAKSLPQTVIKLTDEIFRKGEREQNTPQMLKAYTVRTSHQDALTPDSFYVHLTELKQWMEREQRPVDRAVLNSLLASTYATYASYNRWELRNRTELGVEEEDYPADIREWSGNLFAHQVLKHTAEALKDTEALLRASTRDYQPFTLLGDASAYYHHDMCHLLVACNVDALKQVANFGVDSLVQVHVDDMYKQLIQTYQSMPEREDAFILATLDYWSWKNMRQVNYYRLEQEVYVENNAYLKVLDQLTADYVQREVCAEVYLAKARYYQQTRKYPEALQACDEAIRLYPRYKRIGALKELREEILLPQLQMRIGKVAYPGDSLKIEATHCNLGGFTVNLYRTTLTDASANMPLINASFYNKYTRKIQSQHFSLMRPVDYQPTDSAFRWLLPDAPGIYVVQVVPDAKAERVSESFLHLTRFNVLTMGVADNQYEVVTLDSKSGHPIADAQLTFYSTYGQKRSTQVEQKTTDANGKLVLPWNKSYRSVVAAKGDDMGMPAQRIYSHTFRANEKSALEHLQLITDRSLYRPGQTVYVKGIAYTQQGDTANVVVNRTYSLVLLDVNRREIVKKEVRTNEYGSFTVDFMLPAACLNGNFQLEVGGVARANIRVEEYKRPTFDIVFDSQKASYQLGDSVQVTGKVSTFSGVPLQELELSYVVNRNQSLGWRSYWQNSSPIVSGSVLLADDGTFTIPVSLIGTGSKEEGYYTFHIEASVTNQAGETQMASMYLPVGERSLVLSLENEEQICKDEPVQLTFTARNLNLQPVEVTGEYKLTQTVNGELKERLKGSFTSNKQVVLPEWATLPSGTYKLELTALDDQGREASFSKKIVLFSYYDHRPVVDSDIWLYERSTKFDTNYPAQFSFGTSCKDVYVLVDVFSGNRRLESTTLLLSDSIVRYEVPYLEEYGDGVYYLFTYVKDGQVYTRSVGLEKRLPEKSLVMKWEVFRDKLRPGQKEEWKLTIQTPQGTPADAELLSTMYDASLDKLYPNSQNLLLNYARFLPSPYWMSGYNERLYYTCHFSRTNWKIPTFIYDSFYTSSDMRDVVIVGYGTARSRTLTGGIRGMARAKAEVLDIVEDAAPVNMMAGKRTESVDDLVFEEEAEAQDAGLDDLASTADVRTNFAETAFFYPQLRTNEEGEITFSFTMPESLTSWNFRGYAHTKGMFTGMLNGSTVTVKEFMLSPNLPRFVRVGDKTSIAATITNLTGVALKGTVKFILFDPMTEKIISTQRQSFAVEAGKNIPVSFRFAVTDKYDLLGVRMIADGGTFSDGEQHLLPVLSNKEYLTETLAMPIRGEQTRTFQLDSLFNRDSRTATARRLTVEFTGNPAWYAVQALPALSQPTNDNAVSWATAYYANALAAYIANSQPRIKAVFESWKLQGGSKETFLSQLQKNQEVKNILVEESPWLLEAKTEAEQQARLATLFDLNNLANSQVTALTKLKELQNGDGAWCWYKGMGGSRSMTGFITELLIRLPLLTGQAVSADVHTMQQNAFDYLHRSALDEHRAILKAEKGGVKITTLSDVAMNYLYLIALSGEKVPASNEVAYRYFLSMVPNNLKSGTLVRKAQSAVILQKAGRIKDAKEFVASLKEHLVQTDEQGSYFAFIEDAYQWGMWQVSVQVAVMEALRQVEGVSSLTEEMKIWLLKQKQTTGWRTPVATADAIYALLCQGSDLLAAQGDVQMKLGNKVIETLAPSANSIAGLGYVKETFEQGTSEVRAKTITVEKKDEGIAWGAVYAHYLEDISQVKKYGNELQVEKLLYVERVLADGKKQLHPVTSSTQLSIGDKVVARLTIRVDRNMDFVQLKDQRGACFEPMGVLSGYRWGGGTGYYVEVKDVCTNFFFDRLSKGVYVLEHSYRVERSGQYETGLATIQCAYAPEYAGHSDSMKVEVK